MMGDENTHTCREPPFEATVYNLQAKGGDLEKFRGNSRADLTVEVEQTTEEQQEKKKEHSFLELPVDFSKKNFSKVKFYFLILNLQKNWSLKEKSKEN